MAPASALHCAARLPTRTETAQPVLISAFGVIRAAPVLRIESGLTNSKAGVFGQALIREVPRPRHTDFQVVSRRVPGHYTDNF